MGAINSGSLVDSEWDAHVVQPYFTMNVCFEPVSGFIFVFRSTEEISHLFFLVSPPALPRPAVLVNLLYQANLTGKGTLLCTITKACLTFDMSAKVSVFTWRPRWTWKKNKSNITPRDHSRSTSEHKNMMQQWRIFHVHLLNKFLWSYHTDLQTLSPEIKTKTHTVK